MPPYGGPSEYVSWADEVSPTQWNLALATLLVEETHSLFAAMFLADEKLQTHDP